MTDRRDATTDGEVTSADGTRIAVRRVGTGQPVVLVHGSYGGLDSWQEVAEGLGDGFECWLMARRGHAPSGAPGQANTFAAEVPDVLAVLDAARNRAGSDGRVPHLVGGSYGATLALHTAVADPDALAALALFEPPLFAAGPRLAAVLGQYRVLLGAGDVAGASLLFAHRVARAPAALLAAEGTPDGQDEPDAHDGAGRGTPDHAPQPNGAEQTEAELRVARGALHDLEAMAADSEDIGRWSAVRAPTLVIGGADSWVPLPETMDELTRALPDAEQVVLPGQNHFVTATDPALVARTLRPFLRHHS
ncbi:alpha/beta fold hydrolase [Frankia sp. AiPa1]|uniref:alpha/beta fold hydrolase n=1 Tax=Frankia sp. AiPa1 TaxID=573492 RepID=UPI00202ADE49|nr:alpha/beta fold hydrolase [Frankia sp. AiPa1]MCL9759612.1 alpha/beta hydrolase [Frankia sp. AiPa1]